MMTQKILNENADVQRGGVFQVADVCGQGGREGSRIAEILRTSFMDGPLSTLSYLIAYNKLMLFQVSLFL